MNYSYPTNKEEYWNIVDQHWENLYNILHMYLPQKDLAKADNFRLSKNPEISNLFNKAWENAPDIRGIHSIPSWYVLCDLCSGSYVLHDNI